MSEELDKKEQQLQKRLEKLEALEAEVKAREKKLKESEKKKKTDSSEDRSISVGRNREMGGRGFPIHQRADRISPGRVCKEA